MSRKGIVLLMIIVPFILISCVETPPRVDEKSEIETITQTVSNCIGWFKEKDFDLLFSTVAQDSNYISVHPTDRIIRGFAEFKANSEIFKNPDFTYVRHELREMKVTLSRSGDVAWWSCRLDDMNSWKGQPANWENARWTGVVEKRNGRWVIVQQHFSFPSQ